MHVFFALFVLAFIAVFIYSLVWAYADAKLRGKPGWMVVVMVILLAWPAGLLAWILFRPEETDGIPAPIRR